MKQTNSKTMPKSNNDVAFNKTKQFYVDLKTRIEHDKIKNGVPAKHIMSPQQVKDYFSSNNKINFSPKYMSVCKTELPKKRHKTFGQFYVFLKISSQKAKREFGYTEDMLPTKSEIAIDYLLNIEPKLQLHNKL